jgi:hypothetical protein
MDCLKKRVYWLIGIAGLAGLVFGLLTPPGQHAESPRRTSVWLLSMLLLGVWHAFQMRGSPDSPGFVAQALRGTALAMFVSRILQVAGLLLKMAFAGQFY